MNSVSYTHLSLGYVNAPSLFQQVTSLCCDMTADLSVYERNCKLLVPALREMGYHVAEPGGAFYLFPRSLEPDDLAFSERAKQFDLLLVPGSGFGEMCIRDRGRSPAPAPAYVPACSAIQPAAPRPPGYSPGGRRSGTARTSTWCPT